MGFPQEKEEIQESYCPCPPFFSHEILHPISSKPWRKEICSFESAPTKKGGYLLIVFILKSHTHLDSCNPVTERSQIMGRQGIKKEMANMSQHEPRSLSGACDQQPSMESVQGSGKITN